MRMWVGISLGIHLAVAGAFSTHPAPTRNFVHPGNVYSVSLVSFPAAKPARTAAKTEAAQATEPEKKVETVRKDPPKEDTEAIKPPSPKVRKKPREEQPEPQKTEPKEPEGKKAEEEDVPQKEVTAGPATDGAAASTTEGAPVAASALGGGSTQGTVTLDVANFGFSYYLVALQAKVASNWFPPGSVGAPGEVLRAVVHFQIMLDGIIEDAGVEESSGAPYFDRCALRAILLSSPLAPLPSEFEEDELGVHFEFSHTVNLR
ncbi:MAG: energy transducer TonB [Candidatus Eisenbacteria sp.]|nr:energy transducer TonB [Candidatus Eisenbacteria bacterium]